MDLLRWGRSPWGEWVLTHVSWNLFWASLFAGVLFFVAHASYMLFSAHRKRSAAETDALEAANKNLPAQIERHNLTARLKPRAPCYVVRWLITWCAAQPPLAREWRA